MCLGAPRNEGGDYGRGGEPSPYRTAHPTTYHVPLTTRYRTSAQLIKCAVELATGVQRLRIDKDWDFASGELAMAPAL
jgi:hypothetical protein